MTQEPTECTGMHFIVGLANKPIRISGAWASRVVTTNAPKYLPHLEYSLVYELNAEAPILATLLLSNSSGLEFQRFWRSAASEHITIRLSFMPFDWNHSDAVSVNLYQTVSHQGGGVRMVLKNVDLKHDPRQFVETHVLQEAKSYTGTVVDVASLNLSEPLLASVVLVSKSDTEASHGRWRLKRSLQVAVPSGLEFLWQGRCSGNLPV